MKKASKGGKHKLFWKQVQKNLLGAFFFVFPFKRIIYQEFS